MASGRMRALEEGLLELELLERAGLHRAELGQPGLHRVDGSSPDQ